jgi:hypothetical protein
MLVQAPIATQEAQGIKSGEHYYLLLMKSSEQVLMENQPWTPMQVSMARDGNFRGHFDLLLNLL